MKLNKILLVSIILLAIVSLGAVSASENVTSDVIADSIVEEVVSNSYESEEITAGGEDNAISSENGGGNLEPESDDVEVLSSSNDELLSAGQVDIYVSSEGDDSLDGTSESNAVKTINQAFTLAKGDVIIHVSGETELTKFINVNANSNIIVDGSKDGSASIISNANNKYFSLMRSNVNLQFNNINFKNSGQFIKLNNENTIVFVNCTFNEMSSNSDIFTVDSGSLTCMNCSFDNLIVDSDEYSALIANQGCVFLINTTFKNIGSANLIYSMGDSECTLTNVNISDCKWDNSLIFFSADGNSNVMGLFVENSTVNSDYGLFVLCENSKLNIKNSYFANNVAQNLVVFDDDKANYLSIVNSVIVDNLNSEGSASLISDSFNKSTVVVDGNWWGSNDGPGDVLVNCSANDWIVMDLVCSPDKAYVGDDISVTARFTNSSSGDVANFETSIPVKFSSESKTLDKDVVIKNGEASVDYTLVANDNLIASFAGYSVSLPAANITLKKGSEIKVVSIDGSRMEVTAILKDSEGNAIANATVLYALNNGDKVNVTTDENGEFSMKVSNNCIVDMVFEGNDLFTQCNSTVTLKNIAPTPKGTTITVDKTFTRTAVDFPAGEKGYMFYFTLKDADGKALANKEAKIGVSGKIYTVKTDKNGKAGLMINLANANVYTYAISFLGDDDYKASFAVSKLTVVKKAVTIAPAKTSYTFKSAAKSKVITATLKSTNKFIPSGKKVTLTVGGKTYSAVVAKNGKISLNIAKLTKKGTYKVTIKYAGDGTYKAAASKTITVKIA